MLAAGDPPAAFAPLLFAVPILSNDPVASVTNSRRFSADTARFPADFFPGFFTVRPVARLHDSGLQVWLNDDTGTPSATLADQFVSTVNLEPGPFGRK
jgi:hypothetical protein